NYAARLLGLNTVGIDSNPVAAAIAAAKLVTTTPEAVANCCKRILADDEVAELPTGGFWARCYHAGTLVSLCKLRSALLADCTSAARIALRALILGLLHGPLTKGSDPSYLSNQMPRTFASKPAYSLRFWRRTKTRAPRVDVQSLLQRFAAHFFEEELP